ncbi:2168_t:CDS:2, partial [Scutellospora calospora]
WRTTLDIQAEWSSILSILDQQRNITKYAGPGGWNDPDMLEIGNGDLTLNEQKSHFSLWAALKAPLLLGFDVRNPPKDSMTVVLNTEIIAINQDPLGRSVDIVEYDDSYEIWTGPLIDGYVAQTKIKITLNFKSHLGLKGEIAVRDLWDKKQPNKGNFTESYYSIVPIHSITVLKLQGGIKIS